MSVEEVINMVEECTTDELHDLLKRCDTKQQDSFSLYREMISLTIQHELTKRTGGDTSEVGSTVIEVVNDEVHEDTT